MAMAGVFTEAEIGDGGHRKFFFGGSAEEPADDVIFIQRFGAEVVFFGSVDDAEDEVGEETFVGARGEPWESDVDRHLGNAGHAGDFAADVFAVDDENRDDDVAAPRDDLFQHFAKLRLLAKAAGTLGGQRIR